MRKKRSVVGTVLFGGFCLTAAFFSGARNSAATPDEEGTGLMYGRDYLFSITAPKGWILDNEAGKSQGADAVFYPKGASWKSATVVMYANTLDKDGSSFARIVARDIRKFKQNFPKGTVSAAAPLKTSDSKTRAVVDDFSTPQENRQFDTIAYIDTPKVVVLLTLSSRGDAKGRSANQSALRSLVRSYHFLTTQADTEELKKVEDRDNRAARKKQAAHKN